MGSLDPYPDPVQEGKKIAQNNIKQITKLSFEVLDVLF
jgi:hypothetical protein